MAPTSETPPQYTERILAHVAGEDPLAVQARTAGALERLITGVPTNALRARPEPGRWSVAEIVAHLADAEIVGAFRIRTILGSPGVAVAAYDQDRWAASGQYERRDPEKSLALFRAVRDANLALLASLTPDQWRHVGVHSERGPETIERIVRMFAGHDLNHLEQIARILART